MGKYINKVCNEIKAYIKNINGYQIQLYLHILVIVAYILCNLIEIVVVRNLMYKRFGLSKSFGIGAGSKQWSKIQTKRNFVVLQNINTSILLLQDVQLITN